MYTDLEIRQLPLSVRRNRLKVESFLSANGLRMDTVDYYAAIFVRGQDEILAGGGLCGDTLKCIAVDGSQRDEALANRIVSHLISTAAAEGHSSVKVFTKPGNRRIFESLGFRLLAEAPEAILMENGNGLSRYCEYLRSLRRDGRNGAIVMNANPFTRGHRYLVEQASGQVDNLYVIAVKEDRSLFPYSERLQMIQAGCRNLGNVTVCEGSGYAVSSATFPSYFLKTLDTATDTQITLDLDLFSRHIAPALGVSVRFVGSEPDDRLTARYNSLMRELLPERGIETVETGRLGEEGKAISASALREALAESSVREASRLAWPDTVPYLIARAASDAIRQELDTTPKPGLVDRNDNGAHSDMDYALMSGSIDVLHPYFIRLARLGFRETLPSAREVQAIGMEAEADMLRFTKGVNTYKGALFALGLAVSAAASLYFRKGSANEESLREGIASLAADFPAPQGTNGSRVMGQYRVSGALENARKAYPGLFAEWLPYYRSLAGDPYARHRTLLKIMTSLEDTNIYFRKGAETAEKVRNEAASALLDFSEGRLERMNREFIAERISPGGCADMLSLVIFTDMIL